MSAMSRAHRRFFIGMDVGSTTVKAVVSCGDDDTVLWRDYQRHETRQAGAVYGFLRRIEEDLGLQPPDTRILFTGSGGAAIAPLVGGRFVQEVGAVSLAVEKYYPDVQSVIELGGQDAKILLFQQQAGSAVRRKIATMNDKCAGGTGAVLDKLSAKLSISPERLCHQMYRGLPLHRVAAKCGVFAESDINGLQKQGVPPDELMASLFEAIVLQNLTVLTRGNVLCPRVLLLGGPNTFIPGLREAWQAHIPRLWAERGVKVPPGTRPEDLIFCPEHGQYFGARGAVEFGREQEDEAGTYTGTARLEELLEDHRCGVRAQRGVAGLRKSDAELADFLARYTAPPFNPFRPAPGSLTRAFLGVDGGSTSTKAVLIDENGVVLDKAYRLSQGNPIQDSIDLLTELRSRMTAGGAQIEILGAGVTGYAKNVLGRILKADVALVETVAHARSAMALRPDVDVIVDVGGQDIKLIVLTDGRVKDFMLNTQCSAGNGYFLQATAQSFGIDVSNYAARAFTAERMPEFSYGCAVFLQSDIVNFQRQGWSPDEILAGLAAVLPKNVWLYVAKIPNLAALGRRFLLQGGTQRNLSAVKAQVDYIRARFHAAGAGPEILVHEHCGEAGGIGAALEALRQYRAGHETSFIGLDAVPGIRFEARTNESTRCSFCKNQCLRTFIDYRVSATPQRLIVANCEKGAVEDVRAVRGIIDFVEKVKRDNPNLVGFAARTVWQSRRQARVADPVPRHAWTPVQRRRRASIKERSRLVAGIPRIFNLYLYAPFFSAYLESLGVPFQNIVWSDFTSDEGYREGAHRGAIDPCFPSKVAIAHVHNLIYRHHPRRALSAIFVPMFDKLETHLQNPAGQHACPTVIATPLTVAAAFRRETDVFREHGIQYLHPLLNFADTKLLARQMFDCWDPLLGLSQDENERAVEAGLRAKAEWLAEVRAQAKDVLEMLEREQRLGIVMLGRVYQHDPGLNHGIFDEFQKLGYPILSQTTLPVDPDVLARVFGSDHPLDLDDVWKHSYSASTSQKLWAAKFVARHPNLIGVEVSNFKCGHDAPAYQLIEHIIEAAGRPFFSFRDLDENKPAGAIKIRIETIDYFLRQHRQELVGGPSAWR